MATAGIIGGLGPESTLDYYRRIIEVWHEDEPSTLPHLVIDSLDAGVALRLVATDRVALVSYFADSLARLERAGVDFAAISANTPHIVFDDLRARSPLPLISIVEVCAAEAKRRGLKNLLLLGTRFTMESRFYADVFERDGMSVVTPPDPELTWIHERYVGELLKGQFKDETRTELMSLIARAKQRDFVDGVIFGGTELPLLLSDATVAGIPILDTTALHVRAIVSRLRSP